MNQKNRIKRILISWDFFAAIISAIIYGLLVLAPVSAEIIRDITSLAVSFLSIIFSVFFAALAVLVASGDNEFLKFIQKLGAYEEIIWSLKFTVFVIFISLILSIILYVTALFEISKKTPGVYPAIIMIPYVFISIYALFCTIYSVLDAIKYSEYRLKYIMLQKNKK